MKFKKKTYHSNLGQRECFAFESSLYKTAVEAKKTLKIIIINHRRTTDIVQISRQVHLSNVGLLLMI